MPQPAARILCICLPLAIALGAIALAGPLEPPAGPVAPSFKTLSEVEPRIAINAATTPGDALNFRVISQPGSYYLTANLRPAPGFQSALKVVANHVTIDLNGFMIDGSAVGSSATAGVSLGDVRNAVVKNGTIANFTADGVHGAATASSLIDLAIQDNADGGAFLGADCIARGLRVRAAGESLGMSLGDNALVQDCVSRGGGAGIVIRSGMVARCTVESTSTIGILAPSGSVIDCRVHAVHNSGAVNTGAIVVNQAGNVERCVITASDVGVFASGAVSITDCEFLNCAKGILAPNVGGTPSARIERNLFASSTIAAVSLQTPGHFVAGNRFHQNAANIVAGAGNVIGEIVTLGPAGGTLTAANSHTSANIVY